MSSSHPTGTSQEALRSGSVPGKSQFGERRHDGEIQGHSKASTHPPHARAQAGSTSPHLTRAHHELLNLCKNTLRHPPPPKPLSKPPSSSPKTLRYSLQRRAAEAEALIPTHLSQPGV